MTNEFPTSTPEEELKASHNYREQIQERAITDLTNPFRLLADSDELEKLIKSFKDKIREKLQISLSHLSSKEIDELICGLAERRFQTTKYDGQLGHLIIETISTDVEQEAKKIGLDLRSGVSYGVDYISDESAQISPTHGYSTTSVMLVTLGFIDFCHVAAKLLAMTFPTHADVEGILVSHSAQDVIEQLKKNRQLCEIWRKWLIGESTFQSQLDRLNLTPEQLHTYTTLLYSMEYFAVAHEYGHHIDAHSLMGVADSEGIGEESSYLEELKADSIALRISNSFFSRKNNLYGKFGAGAIIFFALRDIARRAKCLKIQGNVGPNSDGVHPPIQVRIDALISETTKYLSSDELKYYSTFISNVIQSLTVIQEIFLGSIAKKDKLSDS